MSCLSIIWVARLSFMMDSLGGVAKHFNIHRYMDELCENLLDPHVILEPWTLRAPDPKIMPFLFSVIKKLNPWIRVRHLTANENYDSWD